MTETPSRNIGLDLVRVSESAAAAAGRWIGLGRMHEAHEAATMAMSAALDSVDIDGRIVIGEEGRLGEHSPLDSGQKVGRGGPSVDVLVDPIDGTRLVVGGLPGAISLVSVSPEGTMWCPPAEAAYMDKIVVDRQAAAALVPECLDAPAAWTLALVARVKQKPVRDLAVIVLNRPRHRDLIEEIRAAGARILLRNEGDAEGALEAALDDTVADILMGTGGVAEGVIAACAVKALGGGMLGRLAPQNREERQAIVDAGFDPKQILTCSELVESDDIYFAATGITGGPVLRAIRYRGDHFETDSLLLRAATGTKRLIRTEHLTDESTPLTG
jgi:fructose-1,6-bisphosphatase II